MSKKVTIFGAGLVSKPMVDYLADRTYLVTVADIVLSKAQELAKPHPNVTAIQFNSQNEAQVEQLVKNCDLVVSLLPAVLQYG